MKRKLINIIITGLLVTITILSLFTYKTINKFTFAYDLRNIPIVIQNNTIDIQISPNRISLIQCELYRTKDIKDDVGILSDKFTPKELASVNSRTRDLVYNRILSDNNLRNKCMDNLKNNINDLIKPIINKNTNIHFSICDYDVVEQEEDVMLIK